MLPCASRDAGLQPDVAKRSVMAAWMLHGLRFGGKPGQEILCLKWLPPAMKWYLVCAAGAAAVEPSAIGSSSVFCNEWLFMRA